MADKKISQLTSATTPLVGTETLPVVQSGSTVKTPVSDLTAGRAVSMLSATLTGGVANGVVYLNASKVTTSGSALVFDGTNLGVGTASPSQRLHVNGNTIVPIAGSYFSFDVRFGIGTPDSDGLQIFSGDNIRFGTRTAGGVFTERARIDSNGNTVAGASAALATTATDGFLYVPTCAGTPTGTPTAITGMAPIVVDTTNNKLYFYSTGVWRDAGP
jgi:hypothetical protein